MWVVRRVLDQSGAVTWGWQWTPYLLLVGLAATLTFGLAVYAAVQYRRVGRNRPTVLVFFGMMLAFTVWTVFYAARLASADLAVKNFLFRVNVGPQVAPLAWFVFALAYTDRERWLRPGVLAVVASEPLLFAVVISPLNPGGVVASGVTLVSGAGVWRLRVAVEWWYYLDLVWSWLLVVAGMYVITRYAVSSDRIYRGQTAALLVAALTPLVVSVTARTGLVSFPVAPTPIAFSVSCVALAVATFRYEFLNVVPVARDFVIERMRDGYLVVDDWGRVVDSNPAARDLLDLEADPVGRDAAAVFPRSVDLAVGPGHRSDDAVDEFVVGAGADRRHVEVDVSRIAGGDWSGSRLVTLRNVTGRTSVEQRYQTLIERSSDVIAVLDRDGRIQYHSPSVERLLGYDPEELVDESVLEYVHPEDRSHVAELFSAGVTDPGRNDRVEYRFRDAAGRWRTLESVGSNLLSDPHVSGIVVNSRNVTDRVEREAQLAEKNERLDEFASVVSHDLRNPLSVAQGHATLAREDPERHLPEVETALDRMAAIIEDVLALARQGQAVVDPRARDLETLVRQAWSTVETGDATLVVEGTADVTVDPQQGRQLLENLFRNSVEHSSTGNQNSVNSGDSVEHSSTSNQSRTGDSVEHATDDRPVSGPDRGGTGTRRTAETGGRETEPVTVTVGPIGNDSGAGDGPVGFYVADDGPGIPVSERERVFESGYTTAADGTGFGLAIVSRIADAHGWTVRVTESESGGARFEFTTTRTSVDTD